LEKASPLGDEEDIGRVSSKLSLLFPIMSIID
jgi:hypothetical protein